MDRDTPREIENTLQHICWQLIVLALHDYLPAPSVPFGLQEHGPVVKLFTEQDIRIAQGFIIIFQGSTLPFTSSMQPACQAGR
jgi:hypothetical protein